MTIADLAFSIALQQQGGLAWSIASRFANNRLIEP